MMRSARLRFPSNINLLVKRATFRLLYFASGTSGRRTTLLRLGTVCLLINELAWFSPVPNYRNLKLSAIRPIGICLTFWRTFPYSSHQWVLAFHKLPRVHTYTWSS